MSLSAGALELRDGAQELDLPDGAQDAFTDLQKAIKDKDPTIKMDGEKRLYKYIDLPECEEFSNTVLNYKAQDILAILPSSGLKLDLTRNPKVPIIVESDDRLKTSKGYAGMAVLVTGPITVKIMTASNTIFHQWQPGKILVLKPGTFLKLADEGEHQSASTEAKEQDKGKMETSGEVELSEGRMVVFYTLFPVKENA